MAMVTVSPGNDELWRPVEDTASPVEDTAANDVAYRLCANYSQQSVCNWSLPADSPDSLCRACALTHLIPNLDSPDSRTAWAKLETAKRRLIYALLSLQLPLASKREDPVSGLEFQFLGDSVTENGDRSRVLTGHDNGVITINVAEADDVYRESQRQQQHEPYRTLLGHFRHEIGHYYWDRLIAGSDRLDEFRRLFGDERLDYGVAVKRHYEQGAPGNWEAQYISAYATTHPWEDWAETWAHVMHMADAVETAHAVGMSVRPVRAGEPELSVPAKGSQSRVWDFDQLVRQWASVTYVLNNLTRGLGLPDAYPFVISDPVVEKLRFAANTMMR